MNTRMKSHWSVFLVIAILIGVTGMLPAQGFEPVGAALPPDCFAAPGEYSRSLWQEIRKEIESERFAEVHAPPGLDHLSIFQKAPANERPFFKHISDAITVNSERRKIYSGMTGGKSQRLSFALIGFEQCCKIPAIWLDRWARKYWTQDIGILVNDFMPMSAVKGPDCPPLYRGRLSETGQSNLKKLLNRFQKEFMAAAFRKDFLHAAQCSYQTVLAVEQVEKQENCHLAMVRHFLESFGLSALHAIRYAQQSQGETRALSKTFLLVQALPFSTCLWFDLEAQKMHQLGVGILVNDLPAIPFQEEWNAFVAPCQAK